MSEEVIAPITYKVLSDPTKYTTQFRFYGLLHEAYCQKNGHAVPRGDVGMYGEGTIVNNSLTGDLGLIVDPSHWAYCELPEPHLSRLVDVVSGDGWMDIVEEEFIPDNSDFDEEEN
jgi:hypothetical protein